VVAVRAFVEHSRVVIQRHTRGYVPRTAVNVAAGIAAVAQELLPGKGGAREAPEPDPADSAAGAVGQQLW
jgi:hypothetical protein